MLEIVIFNCQCHKLGRFQRHELRPPSVPLHSRAASRKLSYLIECNFSERVQRLDLAIVWIFTSCRADFVGTCDGSVNDASVCDMVVRWRQYLIINKIIIIFICKTT